MLIQYSFLENIEPTDEQLHLLMQEVAFDVKDRAKKAELFFLTQLSELVQKACENQIKAKIENE